MTQRLPVRASGDSASKAAQIPSSGQQEQTPSDYVTLVSQDGFEFHVLRSCATVAGAIKRMLDPASNFAEARTNRCVFENINGVVLEKVCEYFYYNEKHKGSREVPDMEIPPELCLELLMAADYLNT